MDCPTCSVTFAEPIYFPAVGSCCPMCLGRVDERVRRTGKCGPRDRKNKVRKLLERDGDDCWLCGHPLDGNMSLDHVIPRSRGGGNGLDNLRLAHVECNNRRGDDAPTRRRG
jgi:5-methylcytosine-specific restriction endonuclease McrA